MLDLTKAFVTVNHESFFNKLYVVMEFVKLPTSYCHFI